MTDPRIERPSLADAFKNSGSSRAAGLSGLLPKPPAAADATIDQPRPAEQERRAAEKPAAKRPTDRPLATPRNAPDEHEGVQNVAVYLEPEILAVVRAAKARDVAPGEPDKTYDELLVDALERITIDRLREQFAVPSMAGGGPLQRRIRRTRGSGGIQIQLRLDGAQRRALDELVTASDAPSRSALVAVAYRLHLTGDRSAG